MNLGLLAHNQSAYSRATDFLQEGMAAARSLHDDKLLSAILINKAVVLYSTGDHPEAEAVLMNALTLAREVGHRENEGTILNNLGQLALVNRQYDLAEGYVADAESGGKSNIR
jgi:Flp pilus assembly protein TadD